MADHLSLPGSFNVGSRRAVQGPKDGAPRRNRPAHGADLRSQLDAARPQQPASAGQGVDPRFVFKVRASSRLTDSKFDNKGLQLLGEADGWEYFVLPADSDAHTFIDAIRAYETAETGRSFFDLVDGLEPYGPDDRRGYGLEGNLTDLDFPLVVDVHLWPASTTRDARERLAAVRATVGQGELGADEQPDFLLIRARLDRQQLDTLLAETAVERIRLPPEPFLSPTDWVGDLGDSVAMPAPRTGIVGVIDDGVKSGHVLLDGIVEAFEVPSGRTWAPPTNHGTMVAGLAAYGDFEQALRDGNGLPAPLHVVAARVVEDPGGTGQARYPTDQPERVVLERAVRELARRGARVMNLSIADRYNYSGPHVDERTEILDRLARELDLVIIVCSGNLSMLPTASELHQRHPEHLLEPESRIAEPAVGATVVTVGSVARSEQGAHPDGDSPPEMRGVAAQGQVSPFSRSGPGFHEKGTVKPELVHFGGNVVTQAVLSTRSILSGDPGAGAVSLAMPGPFAAARGTSFAAPRVARVAAVLRERYPGASANLTRALLGLSAKVPDAHRPGSSASAQAVQEHLRLAGYGVPNEDRACESLRSRVVMTFDGDMPADSSVIHEVPIPPEFATGKADRTISVALAFDPPVRRFRREYVGAKMRVDLFRAMSRDEVVGVMQRQPSDGTGVKLPKDRRRLSGRLKPSSEAVIRSTLQVRRWNAADGRSMNVDDGDSYFLVVTHVGEPWVALAEEGYASQRYALAVELEDRSRTEINLLGQVRQRLDRIRLRA